MYKVILDTDIGSDVDDALALLLCIRSPEVDLKAVTTVYGDVGTRAKIAKKMLDAAELDVPVGAGCSEPLTPGTRIWHTGYEGQGVLEPEEYSMSPGDFGIRDGVDLLCETLYENEGTYLVTIGALTNIARALEREQGIADRIAGIYSMAGSIRYPATLDESNVFSPFSLRRGEHNVVCDPEAAKRVLESGLPIAMLPVDVTTLVKITRDQAAPLKNGDKVSRYAWNMLDIWLNLIGHNGTCLHDPLTVGTLIDGSFVKSVKGGVEVDRYGRTNPKEGGNVNICYGVDAERFERFYRERVTGHA